MAGRARSYCFTINNPTQDVIASLQNSKFKYLVCGFEMGESGTPHIQGLVQFHEGKTVTAFNKSIGCKKHGCWAHCEPCYGTALEAAGYCKKGLRDKPEGGYSEYFLSPLSEGLWTGFEYGEITRQGRRIDLEQLVDLVKSGDVRVDELASSHPQKFHQYGRTLSKVEDVAMRSRYRTQMTRGTWYWGKTGVGKSHTAFEGYRPDTHYVWKKSTKWQDGYAQQDTVIINEYRGQLRFSELLELVDKWPYFVERRGREAMPFISTHVIITSALHPNQIYANKLDEADSIEQFNRRFKVVELGMDGELPGCA